VPDAIADAAEKLAYELEKKLARPFSRALDELPAEIRSIALVVAVAGVLHQLQQEGLADIPRLLAGQKEA
jgi:hypothetical protein